MSYLVEIEGCRIPIDHAGTLARYYLKHCIPGSFTEALLRNDLFEAVARADIISLAYLKPLVSLVVNYLPMAITRDNYDSWLENKDVEHHELVISHHGKTWKKFLDM